MLEGSKKYIKCPKAWNHSPCVPEGTEPIWSRGRELREEQARDGRRREDHKDPGGPIRQGPPKPDKASGREAGWQGRKGL